MEEKTITIKMKGARPERRVLKSWKFWAFIACALFVAVYEAIDRNWICVIWVIISASFKFFADVFEEYSSDFYDLNGRLILEQEALQDALKEKEAEIIELKMEKGLLTPKEAARDREVIAEEALQWLYKYLQDNRTSGVPTWQIIEDFKTHMDNYVQGTRKQ